MRLTVYIPPDLTAKLKHLAWLEHRYPRQQAEHLLQQAIQQIVCPLPVPQPNDLSEQSRSGEHPGLPDV
jgi:hypothetical protein